MKIFRLNAKPSIKDSRDLVYQSTDTALPVSVDLRKYDSRIEDQETLGSCTANAITSGYEVLVKILYPEKFKELSRLFLYYHSRLFSNELDADNGAYIRDGLKSVKNYGICSEDLWPYNIAKFANQPAPPCYLDAVKRKITNYSTLYTVEEIKNVLANNKPVIVGVEIFLDFLNVSKENPIVKLPSTYTYSSGNHALLIMGYNNETSSFLIKNSFGTSWGDNGYAWIPYTYITEYSFEKWCFDINDQTLVI